MKTLCQEFRELSEWTWQTLAQAADTGLPCSEETITDILLLRLGAQFPNTVKVIPFPKRKEHKLGADWEWWFCDWPLGVGFRIQAKKLFKRKWRFDSLKISINGASQTENLILNSNPGITPLYCFYVFQSRRHYSETLMLDSLQGCRLMRADTALQLRTNVAENLMPHSVPWHNIVCSGDSNKELTAIALWANQLGETSPNLISSVQNIPSYVAPYALDRKRMPSQVASYDGQIGAGSRAPPIRGLVIFNV